MKPTFEHVEEEYDVTYACWSCGHDWELPCSNKYEPEPATCPYCRTEDIHPE